MRARCAVCSDQNCFHVDRSLPAVEEVVVAPPKREEVKAPIYVPAVRDYSAPASGTATKGPSMAYGAKGDKGDPGRDGKDSVVPGPAGRDANIEECVSVAALTMQEEFDKLQVGLRQSVVSELQKAGVIDLGGRAILKEGKPGRDGLDGKDSVVPGPPGKSVKGDPGRDGKDGKDGEPGAPGRDGSVEEATRAAKKYVDDAVISLRLSMRETIIMLLKERGVLDLDGRAVPGPQGKTGDPGPQGKPGNIAAAVANCEAILAKFKEEILAEVKPQ